MLTKNPAYARHLLKRSFDMNDTIEKQADGTYKVSSASKPGQFHIVKQNGECTCEAHEAGKPCRHVVRAAYQKQVSEAAKELRRLALLKRGREG